MFWKIASVRNCKKFCNKQCGIHIVISQNSAVTSRRLIHSINTVSTRLKNYKYFQLLQKPKLRNFERNQSTSSKPEDENEKPKLRLAYALYVIIGLYLLLKLTIPNPTNISFEEFKKELLSKGEVKFIVVHKKVNTALIGLHEGAVFKKAVLKTPYLLLRFPNVDNFEEKLREAETQLGIPPKDSIPVLYKAEDVSPEVVFGFLLLILMLYLIYNKKIVVKFYTDMIPMTKAKFTLIDPLISDKGKGVKFSDVAGLEEAKREIMDFVDYLKRPDIYKSLGARIPKGALLLGPPGCGKTLLAKAVATEANVPFLSMNGSEFMEIIGGLGAARVRHLFQEAKYRIPCIIYIDEIDAIGKKRSKEESFSGFHEEEQTLNQLLVEMDGMESNPGIVLLASTNRAEVLDAALLRPGRFDRHILIDFPTLKERRQIFEQHLKGIILENKPELYSDRLARLTPGFTGADIANVCNEAALHAARLKKQNVQSEDLEYAIERVVGGTEKRSTALSPEERKMLAYYEAGRGLVGWLSKYGEALLKITIVPRTSTPAGWTQFSKLNKHLYSKEDLIGKMCMGLGGRVAVSLLFNRVTTGAENDLKKVTKLAYALVRQYGMSDNIGPLAFHFPDGNDTLKKPYSKALQALFDEEAKRLVTDIYKETEQILIENKEKLFKLAEELLKKETLNYQEVEELIGPPAFKGKKFIEPTEFIASLDEATGAEPEPEPEPESEKSSKQQETKEET